MGFRVGELREGIVAKKGCPSPIIPKCYIGPKIWVAGSWSWALDSAVQGLGCRV